VDSIVTRCLAERPEDVVGFMTNAVQKLANQQEEGGVPRTFSEPLLADGRRLSLKEENDYLQKSIMQLDENIRQYQQVVTEMDSVQLKGSPQAGRVRPNSASRSPRKKPLPQSLTQLQEQAQKALNDNLTKSPILHTRSLSMEGSKPVKEARAAISIQAQARGRIARNQTKEMKEKRENAAVHIQAQARGHISRRNTKEMKETQENAAVKIQAEVRGRQSRQRTKKELETKTEAAIKIQAQARGRMARKEYEMNRPSPEDIKAVEDLLGLKHEECTEEELPEHERQTAAAIKIQAQARGGITRKNVKEDHERRTKAATTIQAQARGRIVRNDANKGGAPAPAPVSQPLAVDPKSLGTGVGDLKIMPMMKQRSLDWTPLNMEEVTPIHINLDLHTPSTPPGNAVFFQELDLTEENLVKVVEIGDTEALGKMHGEEGCTAFCKGKKLLDRAAKEGHLAVVEWLHTHCTEGGASKQAMDDAAGEGHLQVVEWLHANREEGCSKKAMGNAALAEKFDVCDWLHRNRKEGCEFMFLDKAAAANSMACMRWMYEVKQQRCTKKAMDSAAAHGNLEMVEYLHDKYKIVGGTFKAMDGAAKKGALDVVQWLHTNRKEGCTVQAMDGAASDGHLDVVEWLHENRSEGCTQDAINGAARNGWLEVVQWLHANREVQASPIAMAEAAANGHLEVMEFLHASQGTEIPELAHMNASKNFHEDIELWLDKVDPQERKERMGSC